MGNFSAILALLCPFLPVLLSLALVVGLEMSSRTNFESLALALKVKSLGLGLGLELKSLAFSKQVLGFAGQL